MYETVNARVWSRASKYQTMRIAVAAALDAERSGLSRLEARLVALPERDAALGDRRVHERLAVAERDVAVAEVEVARERDLEPLADAERAVRLDVDGDVGREQREAVGDAVPGKSERGAEADGDAAPRRGRARRGRAFPVAR